MNLTLIRRSFNRHETIGELLIDGEFFCYTLEDRDRGLDQSQPTDVIHQIKVQNHTAIPTGVYPVKMTYSPRFRTMLPELLGVKGFRGIRVHSGNHHLHTEGCILLGMTRDAHNVLNSRKAMGLFMSKFNEPCQIQIIRG
jgi:hypothetical protein